MKKANCRPLRGCLVAALICCTIHPASFGGANEAADWDRFRGPNGLGISEAETAPPTTFGQQENLKWKTELPPGSSSPVLTADKIFLTAFTEKALFTIALDQATGEELWRREAPRDRNETLDSRNDPASPSAVTDGKVVSVFFGDYGLVTYDLDGKELWRRPLGPFNNLYGMGASPILVDDLIILPLDQQTGSSLQAFDLESGEPRWQTARPEAKTGHSTPYLYEPSGGKPQVILPGSFFLTSYDAATGERLWWVRGLSFEMKSVPAIFGDLLFINGYGSQLNEEDQKVDLTSFENTLARFDGNKNGELDREEATEGLIKDWFAFNDLDRDGRINQEEWKYFGDALETRNNIMAVRLPKASERGDLSKSHTVWQYFRSVPQLPSPIVYGDLLYMINDRGLTTTFEPETGEVVSQGRIEGAVDSFYASPVAGNGKLYFASRSGSVAVLKAGGSLEPLAVNNLEETITASPALAGGILYLRTDKALYAFAEDGAAKSH